MAPEQGAKSSFKIGKGEFEEDERDSVDPLGENVYDDQSDGTPSVNSSEGGLYTPWEKVRLKKQRKAKAFLVEMIAYIMFIVVFCMTVFVMRSPWTFWSADTVRTELRLDKTKGGYLSISTSGAFFEYLEDTFVPNLFPVETYNGADLTRYSQRYMAVQNRVIGTARIRQVRVNPNENCRVSTAFRGFVRDCYGEYTDDAMSKDPFGPASNRSKYHWSSTSDLCAASPSRKYCSALIIGKSTTFYPSSGYVVDLPTKQADALKAIREMYDDHWADPQTRAVMVDFTVFNPNVQMFVVVQLLVEWLPTGSVVPRFTTRPLPTLKLDSFRSKATLTLEILLSIYLFCYFMNEIAEFYSFARTKKHRCVICRKKAIYHNGLPKEYQCNECGHTFNPFTNARCKRCLMEYDATRHMCWKGYFQHMWNWLDIVNLAFFVAVLGLRFELRSDLEKIEWDEGSNFVLLYPLAAQYSTSNYLNSVNALLCFVKTFKYLGKFKNLAVLIRTLSNARSEIGYFLVIFGIIFTGFALAFQVGFGSDVEEYSNFSSSVMSLFRMLLGEFDYFSLQNSNRVLAPIFFVFYNILVLMVMSNMFIAIISGAYANAIAEQHTLDENYLSSALRLFFNDIRAKFARLGVGGGSLMHKLFILIENLEKVRDLTPDEQDNLREFRYDLELNPDERDLMLHVYSAFDRKVDRQMDLEDYFTLKKAIAQFRNSGDVPEDAGIEPRESALKDDVEEKKADNQAGNGKAVDAPSPGASPARKFQHDGGHDNTPTMLHSPPRGVARMESRSAFFGKRVASTNQSMMNLRRKESAGSAYSGAAPQVDGHAAEVMNSKLKNLEDSITTINQNLAQVLDSLKSNYERTGRLPSARRNPSFGGESPGRLGGHPLRLSAQNLQSFNQSSAPPAAVPRRGGPDV
eukprot:TRINITY_DN19397_c0_g1_i1.p1 TRINITY_DN19397_c0_g1~~TRINITY_DN19397_c0_g1_i1.p1  ORF type:complete len:914 (+),score=350.76 TRINITY_DN19397_c0_g1_i1:121-2862(+)